MNFLLGNPIFRCYVSFREGISFFPNIKVSLDWSNMPTIMTSSHFLQQQHQRCVCLFIKITGVQSSLAHLGCFLISPGDRTFWFHHYDRSNDQSHWSEGMCGAKKSPRACPHQAWMDHDGSGESKTLKRSSWGSCCEW